MGRKRAPPDRVARLDRVIVAPSPRRGLRSAELLGLNRETYETATGDTAVRHLGKASKPGLG